MIDPLKIICFNLAAPGNLNQATDLLVKQIIFVGIQPPVIKGHANFSVKKQKRANCRAYEM